jgi:hypothetical protein
VNGMLINSINSLKFSKHRRWMSTLLTVGCLFMATPSFGLYYMELAYPLFPMGAKVFEVLPDGPTREWSERIDRATLQILSTPTGKYFCGAVVKDPQVIKNAFFLNESAAQKAISLCENRFAERQVHIPFQKHFVIVLSPNPNFKVDGWTSPRNETFIFLNESEMLEARLVRTLAHEMAVSFDRKEQIGSNGIIDFPKLGIRNDHQSCIAITLLRQIYLKHALTAMRAFEIEGRIAAELGIPLPQGFAQWKHLSCEERFQFIFPFITPLSQSLQAEFLVNGLLDAPLCSEEPIAEVGSGISEKIKKLSELHFTFQDGTQRNVCDYMSEGLPFYPGISFRGGPGPRIGGGGWSSLKELNDLHEKDSAKKPEIKLEDDFRSQKSQKKEFEELTRKSEMKLEPDLHLQEIIKEESQLRKTE